MEKTVDERLFERLMQAPHRMRFMMRRETPDFGGPHRPEGPGCHGHGPHGHGPCGEHGHGPHGHGPCGGHGKGPMGRGARAQMRMLSRERILGIVLEREDGIRQKEIAEAMHIGPSATSEFIDKLELAGYLDRRPDPDDGRATRIYLTEKGKARAYELQDERRERFGRLFEGLTEDEKVQLLALLDKLAASFPGKPGCKRPAEKDGE